ncbi:MAG: glycosyltransferase family 87 protein [Candidatus Sulfotelmatobacter sp.]
MKSAMQGQPSRNLRVILWLLIVLAGAEFVVRGPVRYLRERSNWNDLSQNYTAAKLWLQGESPSDPANFVTLWKQEGHSRLNITDIRTHMAPPLGGLVVLAPVAALPWRTARVVWIVLLMISVGATIWALARAAGLGSNLGSTNNLRTLTFIAACLALAPFQTDLASGNTSVLVIALCALAIWAARSQRDTTAAVLFGAACAVKPQLGAFLVLYYLVQRRWRLFTMAVATTLALNLIAIVRLRGTSWVQDYLHNARGFVSDNPIDDFTTANPARFALINLQVPFFSITGSAKSANWLSFGVVFILVCVWIYWVIRNGEHVPEFLALGAISAVALLPVYHRFYDASLLAIPLCWCILSAAREAKLHSRLALLLMLPFLFPGSAFLQQLAVRGTIPNSWTNSWLWKCVLVPHETWAILLLSLVLIYAMKASSSRRQNV